jgi:integrase
MAVRRGSYVSKKTGKPVWICDYRDQHGKRHELSFVTKKEADAEWARAQGEIRQRTHTADTDSITVDEARDIFIGVLESEGAAPATIDNHTTYYRNHVSPFLGSRRLSRLASHDVQKFLDELVRGGRSADTRRRAKITLGAILDEAVRQGYVAINVARAMRARRRMRRAIIADSSKMVIPEKVEVRALFNAETTTRGRAQLATLCFAGLRIGEMRGITWPSIDLKDGFINVEEAADRFNNWGPVKTVAGKRTVPIGPRLARALKEWKGSCPESEWDLVFPTSTGTVQSYANVVNRWLAPLLVQAGLGKLVPVTNDDGTQKMREVRGAQFVEVRPDGIYTPHSFRHFAVSLWIDEGATAKQVSGWAGHEDVAFTMRVYGHLFKDKARERDRIAAAEVAVLG